MGAVSFRYFFVKILAMMKAGFWKLIGKAGVSATVSPARTWEEIFCDSSHTRPSPGVEDDASGQVVQQCGQYPWRPDRPYVFILQGRVGQRRRKDRGSW